MSYEIRNDKLLREAYEAGRLDALNDLNEAAAGGGNQGPIFVPTGRPGKFPGGQPYPGYIEPEKNPQYNPGGPGHEPGEKPRKPGTGGLNIPAEWDTNGDGKIDAKERAAYQRYVTMMWKRFLRWRRSQDPMPPLDAWGEWWRRNYRGPGGARQGI